MALLPAQRHRGDCRKGQSLADASGGSGDIGIEHSDRPFEKDRVNQMDRQDSSPDLQPIEHRLNEKVTFDDTTKYLEVEKTLFHFSFIGNHILVPYLGWSTKLDISMPFKVEFGEAADITTSINMNSEFPEEVDDGRCTMRQGEPEYKGSEDNGENFLHEYPDF